MMYGAIDRLLITGGCFLMMMSAGMQMETVCALLLMVVTASCGIYFSDKRVTGAVILFDLIVAQYSPVFSLAMPLLTYELCGVFRQFLKKYQKDLDGQASVLHVSGGCFVYLGLAAALTGRVLILWLPESGGFMTVAEAAVTAAAVWLFVYNIKYTQTRTELIRTVDNSHELSRVLQAKNRDLIERQDTEIYMATLRERNRIAREIHDNVGHMLSRSILQTGALLAVNTDERRTPMLLSLKETLDTAMSSIRSSVHDLHEDSVDLPHAVEEILRPLAGYTLHYEYDLSQEIPQSLKYCMISIVKEAVSNILRHSNADTVTLILREHPAFYQIWIQDNGRGASSFAAGLNSGIGLIGMRERLAAFSGTLDISTESGFRLFIHIPKQNETEQPEKSERGDVVR